MDIKGLKTGFAMTGSFCTIKNVFPVLKDLVKKGAEVIPIMSKTVANYDTRFGKSEDIIREVENITSKKIIKTITEAEPIGPKKLLDVLVVAPCTGNTIAKISNAITDGPVTMACKSHLRNNRPIVIAVSTNDGLGANAKNIGTLLNLKNIYFVPFKQDAPESKPNSLMAKNELIINAIEESLKGNQIQPLLTT